MQEIDVELPDKPDWQHIARTVDRCATFSKLTCTSRGTLKRYPGCVHWHFKRGKLRRTPSGTLEITAWEQGSRLWIKIQKSRKANWMAELVPLLKRAIERAL